MSFLQEREKRANAGNRMRALIDQEVDMEELFEYKEDDEEDEEFAIKIEEEEDKVDSDFDLDSSEGEEEYIEEGKALDKQIERAEKKSRRAATFNPPAAAAIKPRKNVVEKKKKRKTIEDEEERSTRYSSRKNTMLNRIQVEDQMREHRKKKALQPKRERPVVNKLTQKELLAEAAITEEQNKHSLLEWQQKEAERKENAKKKEKKSITGTFVRYYSFADGKPKSDVSNEKENEQDIANTETISSDWQNELMGRNLISFLDSTKENGESGIATQTARGIDTTDTDKDLGMVDLIDQLRDWLNKAPKPIKPVLCPVTGEIAKYRDPHTNVPYANIQAYELIKSCLHHDMKWSSSSGLYLGQLPSAKGVPGGWNSSM